MCLLRIRCYLDCLEEMSENYWNWVPLKKPLTWKDTPLLWVKQGTIKTSSQLNFHDFFMSTGIARQWIKSKPNYSAERSLNVFEEMDADPVSVFLTWLLIALLLIKLYYFNYRTVIYDFYLVMYLPYGIIYKSFIAIKWKEKRLVRLVKFR